MSLRITKINKKDNKEVLYEECEDEGDVIKLRILWEREGFRVKIEDLDKGNLVYESRK